MKKRMMKGDEEPEMVIGTIIFVCSILFIFGIMFLRFSDFSVFVRTSQDSMAAINEAHMAVACLAEGNDLATETITKEKLDSCRKDYSLCVKDMETKEMWFVCPDNPDHVLYLPIESGNSIHMGELDVKK